MPAVPLDNLSPAERRAAIARSNAVGSYAPRALTLPPGAPAEVLEALAAHHRVVDQFEAAQREAGEARAQLRPAELADRDAAARALAAGKRQPAAKAGKLSERIVEADERREIARAAARITEADVIAAVRRHAGAWVASLDEPEAQATRAYVAALDELAAAAGRLSSVHGARTWLGRMPALRISDGLPPFGGRGLRARLGLEHHDIGELISKLRTAIRTCAEPDCHVLVGDETERCNEHRANRQVR